VPSLFDLDIDEYAPMGEHAVGDSDLEVHHDGPYVELTFADGLTIDRVSTGVRHAFWYSGVAALRDTRVVQFDMNALWVVAA
jgi:hypothetical protein